MTRVTGEMLAAGIEALEATLGDHDSAGIAAAVFEAMDALRPNPLTEMQDLDQRLNASGNNSWVEGELACERVRKE